MAASLSFRVDGGAKLRKALSKLNPGENARIFTSSARQAAVLIAANARNVQLRRGRGAVHATQLTSRSFYLRDHIGPDFRGFPRFAETGTDVFYGAIHEFGLGGFDKRPFMAPALDAVDSQSPGIIVRNWKKEAGL